MFLEFFIEWAYKHVVSTATALRVAVIFAYCLLTKNKKKKSFGDYELPPFPPFSFFETGENLSNGNLPWFFLDCADKVGHVFRLNVPVIPGGMYVVGVGKLQSDIMSDPKTVKPISILKGLNFCFGGYPTVLTTEGAPWKHRIKAVSPAFSSTHVKRMDQVCDEFTKRWLSERIKPLIDKNESFDVGEEMVKLTISVIAKAAFEYEMTTLEADQYAKDMSAALNEFAIRQNRIPSLLFGSWWNKQGRRALLATRHLQDFAKKVIKSYRDKPGTTKTLIHCIVDNPNYANDDERAADITVFFLAGHDTTGNSMAWTILELAKNPSEMASLRRALSLVPREEWKQTRALQNVIREGMRLNPAVSGGPLRTVGRAFFIPDKNMVIPKGCNVLMPNILSGRDPAVFENPDKFVPSRWEESDAWNQDFFPFATSRHSCPGQALANAEMPTVIAALVERYDLEIANTGGATFDATTLRPVKAMLKAKRVSG